VRTITAASFEAYKHETVYMKNKITLYYNLYNCFHPKVIKISFYSFSFYCFVD